ncbi:MAG: T9SS type A sorting domain-containing protein [Paludibacter sp.]|nr:T9SS type A sorting domain-containing protein [Paludibacter sp.]
MLQIIMKASVLLVLGFGFTGLHAQEAITTSGGRAVGSGGFVDYTVGQIAYTTNFDGNYSVAQGVQQPYEITVETDPRDALDLTLTCSAYPNPVVDFLTLHVENYIDETIEYTLYDAVGKLLTTGSVEKKKTMISMVGYISSTYTLKVIQKRNETMPRKTKVFKIIQNTR